MSRLRLPSGLNIEQWRKALQGYSDYKLVEFLEYGWPIGIDGSAYLQSYNSNHKTALEHPDDIEHYIATELGHRALLGPFAGSPTAVCHFSPLMTRPKRDSIFRRVIIDLSWPKGWSVNDGISRTDYIDGPMTISLTTWKGPSSGQVGVRTSTRQTCRGGISNSGLTPWTGPSSRFATSPRASWTFVRPSGSALLPWPCNGSHRPSCTCMAEEVSYHALT